MYKKKYTILQMIILIIIKKNLKNLQNVCPGRIDGWGWWAGEIVSLHHRCGWSISALFDTFPRWSNWRYLLCG